jgi:ABC-type branched-subunit amino acid transport system substrate-binding protein
MIRGKWKGLVAVAAIAMVAAACSSSSKSTSGSAGGTTGSAGSTGSTGGNGKTLTVGVLTDLTGLGSTSAHTLPEGVKVGVGWAASQGYNIKYVVTDTATSPAQALTSAQKLVTQDHVFAVIANSAITFAAAPFLASHGIPVVGAGVDATEWITDRNMFSVIGDLDFTRVYSVWGEILKRLGVTNLASLGYSISPSSADTAKGNAISAQLAGLKVGYLNANFPFGGTNVGPAALAIKAAGSDGLITSIEQNTEFALVDALRNEGAPIKVVLNATGYGADLAGGGPGATRIAQGQYFLTSTEPMEMNTPATQKAAADFKKYGGITGDPTFGEYQGYMSIAALVQGLKAAGSNPTQASFIDAMNGITNFTGLGLYGNHSVDFSMANRGKVEGADDCDFITQYSGSSFHLVNGMEPICGITVPGQKV